MYMIWTTNGTYRRAGYADEADLEAARYYIIISKKLS